MVAIGRSSHAFFFDGVSDSILIPQGRFTKLGDNHSIGAGTKIVNKTSPSDILSKTGKGKDETTLINSKFNDEFAIEAWVIPDCGGIIAEREGQFKLEIGTVDTPGPAKFTVYLDTKNGTKPFVLSTATDVNTRWDGIVFPEQEFSGIHDSYNRYDLTNYNDATNLNFNHRPLYHIVGAVSNKNISLFVNGKLLVSQTKPTDAKMTDSTAHVYVGGKGGDYRGVVESIHFVNRFDEQIITPNVPMDNGTSTTALYRFEEPIDVIEETYTITALGSDSASPYAAATDGTTTTLTISATDAQALIERLTGKQYDSTNTTINFTESPYSMGNYATYNNYNNPNTPTANPIPHTPYNIIINPGAINRNTHKPNNSPPERLRILSINGATGVITVNSIHLDFTLATTGLRGILHSRTKDVDDYFVVVPADLLIDLVTGKPYQPPHFNTQIIDKTGQMILDETINAQHGIVYSSQMATSISHPLNPFAVTWPTSLNEKYQVGHSGRHKFSHIEGHEYMRRYPRPTSMKIDQKISGSADIVEMDYANTAKGVDKLFIKNQLADFYNENSQAPITTIVNNANAGTVFTNGLIQSKEEIIAITVDDHKPFMLKGPIPQVLDRSSLNQSERYYHLKPETESRVALLHVPTLKSTHNLAPYVEIHYNAIDLTGDSMQAQSTNPTPMLMVEKTVPKGSLTLTGTTTVLDVIKADIADVNKDTTIYSPGGYIELANPVSNMSEYFTETNSLIGDNTGGAEYDIELNFDFTPRKEDFTAGYTPSSDSNAQPATTPQVITSSHNKSTHPSVYHKLCIEPTSVDSITTLTDLGNTQFKMGAETINTATATFDKGGVNQGSPIFEMFDIIDNLYVNSSNISARIYIQPSKKTRTNQLAKLRNGIEKGKTPNLISLYFLASRTRIRSVKQINDSESNSVITQITATGIVEEAINETVSLMGSGSPNSHVVQEIEPNAPVVSITLGGPGQGAINTKPTYDPSPLMRLPGSTRRNCVVRAISVCTLDTVKNMSVQPLNNDSEDIRSWGTYAFPKKGRIFLNDGANAEYSGKVAAGFFFDDANAIAERKYISSSGDIFSSFNDWCLGVDLISNQTKGTHSVNENIFNDIDFSYENLCDDGSTVNDRLFQSIDDVVHDYQLSTQYASTRAMVEIPVFPQQFFDQQADGIFPGPDNSMKVHLDATYTAHTWNPTPVGRRVEEIQPNDREANSAYSENVEGKKYFTSTSITQIVESGNDLKIYVENINVFPNTLGPLDMNNFKNVVSNHRFFIDDEWAYYTNNPITDGYVKIYNKPSTIGNGGYYGFNTEELFEKLVVGCKVSVGVSNPSLKSINSDITTQSSDYENRSPYYHDTANVQTQGGNLDYGLRQYVSAVEFKAGPLSNPHAPRTKTKRASAKIIQGTRIGLTQIYALELDNVEHFIDTNYTLNSIGNPIVGTGDLLVIGKVLSPIPVEVLYLGTQFNSQFSLNTTNNNTVLVQFGTGVTVPNLQDVEFRLEKIGRSHLALSAIAQITSKEGIVSTFRPTTANEIWNFVGTTSATSTTSLTIDCASATRSPVANTIGLNLRPGDMLYKEATNGDISYVGTVAHVHSRFHVPHATNTTIVLTANNAVAITDDEKVRVGINSVMANDADAILNKSWCNPYAAGGLRNGDTVWMNMTMNNAHAVEGLFAKSRGVFNEAQVYKAFNGGEGQLTNRPRDSIPLENFLIGDSCLETAINFVQHVNKTIELNYEAMGLSASQAPTIAYIDPYLASDGHTRVLLYDVAHDREFISFHDIHMQVQTSPSTPVIGHTRNLATKDGYYQLDNVLTQINGGAPHYLTTQIDVANGFPSENRYIRSTQQSKFIESAYSHNIANQTSNDLYPIGSVVNGVITGNPVNDFIMENPLKGFSSSPITNIENEHYMGKGHGHVVHSGLYHESVGTNFHIADSVLPRIEPATHSSFYANKKHNELRVNKGDTRILPMVRVLKAHRRAQGYSTFTFKDNSTFFDTPDGTRVISAFLCLKGIRSEELNLINHEESRLQHLPQWTKMDYIRRQTIDFGEVGVKEGVTDIEAAAREIVRMVNQGAAKNGRTHARRPSHQYPGESERMDLTRIGVREDVNNPNKDPASAHVNADFAATGSTHDPAPFWSLEHATATQDRGSHMGYLRAHIGRVIEDINGVEGFTVVIHSTVPGASGRNFCAWLDNSKGQSPYQPQFLVGHGGRFRNFWCQQDETMGENMHPAPMPLNKHGRPFAPITTLREMINSENSIDDVKSNHDYISRLNDDEKARVLSSHVGSGAFSNTIFDESFESQSQSLTLVEGLRIGTKPVGRINFGGLVAAGVPGFSPIVGKFGCGVKGDNSFDSLYGSLTHTYGGYIDGAQIKSSKVGTDDLYGFKFTDHRGKSYGVRYVYKRIGDNFTNDNTLIPNSLDNEIGVFFDDRDVSQGGFTLGNHIVGKGDATGQITDTSVLSKVNYKGNRWRGVYAPDSLINASVKWESATDTLTVKFAKGSIYRPNTPDDLANIDDLLGYLGFPKQNGVIQLNDAFTGTTVKGSLGNTLSYTTRSQVAVGSNTHIFYGVKGSVFTASHRLLNSNGDVTSSNQNAVIDTATFTDNTCDTNSSAGSGTTFGSNPKIIQIDSTSLLHVGMGVSGTGIAGGSVITQIDSTTLFRVDLNTTATNNNQTLTFTPTVPSHPTNSGEWAYVLISSRMNWTTLLTDEVMAAATEAAINLVSVNQEEGVSFDCTNMLAADGRTLGEWGVSPDAIKLRAFNPNNDKLIPLSTMFSATRHEDKGIEAAHAEYGMYTEISTGGAITGLEILTAGIGYYGSNDQQQGGTYEQGYTIINPTVIGGSGTGLQIKILTTTGSGDVNSGGNGGDFTQRTGGVATFSIVNAGNDYKVGDIITLTSVFVENFGGQNDLNNGNINQGPSAIYPSQMGDISVPPVFCTLRVVSTDGTVSGSIIASAADNKPLSDADLLLNKQVFCGYVPKTVLQIESKGRGFHANTPTPVLVDSTNSPIDTSVWAKNLKGIGFTRSIGDHIIPCINEVSFGANTNIRRKNSINTIAFSGNSLQGTGFAKNIIYSTGGKGAVLSANAPTQAGSGFNAGGVFDVFGGSGKGMKVNLPTNSVPPDISDASNFSTMRWDLGEGYVVGDALWVENNNTLSTNGGTATALRFTVASVSSGEGAKIMPTAINGAGGITAATVIDGGKNFVVNDYIRVLPVEDGKANAFIRVTGVNFTSIPTDFVFAHDKRLHATLVPQSADTNATYARYKSVGERGTFYIGKDKSAVFRSDGGNLLPIVQNEEFIKLFDEKPFADTKVMMTRNPNHQINGRRFYGSVDSEPIVYFRGAKDSVDHSVPLYFGGGFTGVTVDINDGTKNDYSTFYTHPYSNGPTGTAGIQNANEISTSFATLDCNALFAFFPGAALVNQNRGSLNSPVFNKNNILSPDVHAGMLEANTNNASWVNSKYSAGVVRQKPTPLVLQFAHPTARYEDYQNAGATTHTGKPNVENKTMYLIYGPGQAIPFSESTHNIAGGSYPSNTQEPHPGTVVTVGNTWSKVPYNMNLPNALTNDANVFAPPTKAFQAARNAYHYAVPSTQAMNWSPPAGVPNKGKLEQRPEHGYHYGEHFNNPRSGKMIEENSSEYFKAHPYKHSAMTYFGIAMSADMTWHMDGGYHPGGHWLDNQVAANPKNHTSNTFVTKWGSTPVHPTAFRVSSKIVIGVSDRGRLTYTYNEVNGNTPTVNEDCIIVDATRCQNGEELATIIGQAINENPGKGALKALGGTFMPSMGNANRQDRYGWTELTFKSYEIDGDDILDGFGINNFPFNHGEYFGDGTHSHINAGDLIVSVTASISGDAQNVLEQLPACGWIRTDAGGRDFFAAGGGTMGQVPAFAPYHSREVYLHSAGNYRVRFYLAPNRISGLPFFEDGYSFYNKCQGASGISFPPITTAAIISSVGNIAVTVDGSSTKNIVETQKVFVWSKAGVHRFNNENEATRDHMTQVHFSGLVDAIDRTRPVGAVGWAGERYSYLNSLKVETDGGGNKLYAAGLGAWYEKLGFSPYGSSNSCMGLFGVIPSQGIQNSPEASPIINGRSNYLTGGMGNPYTGSNMFVPTHAFNNSYYTNYTFTNTVGSPHFKSVLSDDGDQNAQLGVYSRAFLVVSHESELPLVAKYDRDGITGLGDWLNVVSATKAGTAAATAITYAGTTRWDERFHGANRFIAPATAGPKVEALITPNLQIPTSANADGDITALGVHESYPLLGKTESIDLVANLTGVASGANTEVTTSGGVTTAGLAVGMYLSHANLPINTQIVSIESTTKFLINTTPSTTGSATVKLIAFGNDDVSNATPCLHPTGDISNDLRISPATKLLNNSSIHLNRQGFQTELNTKFGQMVDRTELQADYGTTHDNAHIGNTNAFNVGRKSVSRNFTVENVVWKRMDGGNLSLPSSNAKGLGAIPLITRVKNNAPLTMGEKIFGNNRFSFETTNSSMFPIIQAQELMHPQHATKSPNEIKNALNIPNEEIQFKSISVEDDTGQVHTIEGGSPFGTIIRGFRKVSDRASEGLAPAVESDEEKYVGVEPNLEIQLPDPNTIPGNILVRSGFDSIQAYQHETIGSGGMMRPSHNNHNGAGQIFDEDFDKLNGEAGAVTIDSPRLGPTYEDYGWEHISQKLDGDIKFPDSTKKGWTETTGNNPLNTSYKQHDRTLFFHVTKKSLGFTEKYPVGYSHANGVETQEISITASSPDGFLTLDNMPSGTIFDIPMMSLSGIIANLNDVDSGSAYYRIKNTDTGQEGLITGRAMQLRGGGSVRLSSPVLTKKAAKILYKNDNIEDIDFSSLPNATYSNLKIYPSFPVPAGNTRFYAARRMRDHAEVSGNSPDAKHQILRQGGISFSEVYALISQGEEVENVAYYRFEGGGDSSLIDYFEGMNLTPMAVPRMGHHFVNATMAVMPGHWAHPAYQNLYHKHRACRSATLGVKEKLLYEVGGSIDADTLAVYDPMLVFGGITATPSGPSDIHGGAFTLMFETKIKHDGYGILASEGEAGSINKQGGHTIVLRAGLRNTFNKHFPDPSKVGAYQIIIQPNVFSSQLVGFHENGPNNNLPDSSVINLTSQQTALVVGIRELDTNTGGMGLVLAHATMADVRGCEVMINEVILDHDPDHGGQFTNIPNLMTYNPFGVQGTEAPAFTRQSLPYHPQMFVQSTPGMTTNIPWWSIVHPEKPTTTTGSKSAKGFRFLSHHRLDNYYLFIRANAGSIGAQLTLAGYPSTYPNMYDEVLRSVSLNPNCEFISESGNVLTVDDASDFPIEPMYGEMIYYIDANGVRRTSNWSTRSGFATSPSNTMNRPKFINLSSPPAGFVSNLTAGTILRLTKQNDISRNASEIFTDSERSIMTRTLPQTLQGSRDTNSLHLPDSFICSWSPYLGISLTDYNYEKSTPNHMPTTFETIHYHDSTYYASLGPFALDIQTPKIIASLATNRLVISHSVSSKTITTNSGTSLSAGDRISVDGRIYTVDGDTGTVITVFETPPNDITVNSAVMTGGIGDSMNGVTGKDNAGNLYRRQGGTSGFDNPSMSIQLYNYWPCGSRGGPIVSRLDGFGYVSTGWMKPTSYDIGDAGSIWHDDGAGSTYDVNAGVDEREYENRLGGWASYTSGDMPNTRPRPFGYRFGLRQPYNKPRWAWYGMRAYIEQELDPGNIFIGSVDYKHGPLVEARHRSDTWAYAGGKGSPSGGNDSFDTTYVGILERQTNFAGMENILGGNRFNKYGKVTRYSDGMRMTRPFGCPVRTLRNNSSNLSDNTETNLLYKPHIRREWLGDDFGHGILDVALASQYYLIDWWGNTRGEDVRRMPVRGFGISPAWSSKEANIENLRSNKFINGSSANPYNPFYAGHTFYNFKKIIPASHGGLGTKVEYRLDVTATTTDLCNAPYDVIPSQVGSYNAINSNIKNEIVDFYFPERATRVGDEGNGRGIRPPTSFMQAFFRPLDVLDELPKQVPMGTVPTSKGAVLSHNTAEPNIGNGYIRPKNTLLGTDEVPRGISARLKIDDYGLLKPDATLSHRQLSQKPNTVYLNTPYTDVVSRSSPKIGLDVENFEGIDNNAMIITTEAHSLHTNYQVGQRGILRNNYFQLEHINNIYSSYKHGDFYWYFNNASMFKNLGGTNILELKNYSAPVSLGDWGSLPTNGLVLWLRADDLDLEDGDSVDTWHDQSGDGRNFTQSTASKKPTFVASDATFNSKPCLSFDGGDQLSLAFDANLNSNEFTIFMVMSVTNDNDNLQLGYESYSSTPVTRSGFSMFGDMTGSDNQWEFWAGADTSWSAAKSAVGSITLNQPDLLTMFVDGGNGAGGTVTAQTLRVDGTVVQTLTPAFYKSTSDAQNIGTLNTSSTPLIGKIAEIIQFDRHLFDNEISQWESYLSIKYGITIPNQYKSPNPYFTGTYNADANKTEKEISLMLRPIRKINSLSVQFFSAMYLSASSPQYISTYSLMSIHQLTVGGKYGIFAYDMPNARASTGFYLRATNPDTNPPYVPIYNNTVAHTPLILKGNNPTLSDIDANGITYTDTVRRIPSMNNTVGRVVISENTLQHYRADASRKKTINEDGTKTTRKDFTVQPRFSQSLHPKGHKGDVSFNDGDHTGDGS